MERSKNEGITLITLVITIIILLILAGIAIAMLTGENGILNKANTAQKASKEATAKEKVQVAVLGSYGTDGKLNNEELKTNLDKIEGIKEVPESIKDEDFPITVEVDGYEVTITKEGNVTIKNEIISKPEEDGKWNEEAQVNSPKLMGDMQAVYWDENGNEVLNDKGSNWYQYIAGDNQNDTKTSKWANAKTADGSYWVWIPRYEYKILSREGTSTAGKIEVKFIPTSQTTADKGYKIHPAFQNGTGNQFKNGEWDSELDGIWVAKFEMSMETNGIATTPSSEAEGNIAISESIKMVSKPDVSSWRWSTIGNSYTNCYNYDRSKESHLMKNSEWGAVAYLTHSQMGRNGHEITINNNSDYITGIAGDSVSEIQSTQITNHYKTTKGGLASSTGNITGIYDLSGGSWEMTAGHITNGNENLSNGKTENGIPPLVAKTSTDTMAYQTLSSKYVTVYPYASSDSMDSNYVAYKNANYGYGDAILETSSTSSNTAGWFEDFSCFAFMTAPFFTHGGYYVHETFAGAFAFSRYHGGAYSDGSFRVVLAPV